MFEYKDAFAYEQAPETETAFFLERQLMLAMVRPLRGKRLIDIGCGTGTSLQFFQGQGAYLTGVDASPYMLDIAQTRVGSRVDLHRAYAEDLPFDDNFFHYACLCFSLEFVEDPEKALAEACRVAREGVFVGLVNKYSAESVKLRIKGVFQSTVYNRARFYSIGEVKRLFRMLLGDVPVYWRTVGHLPASNHRLVCRVESSGLMQKLPFGVFAGVLALPVPRLQTIPLALKAPAKSAQPVSGVISCPGHSSKAEALEESGEAKSPADGAAAYHKESRKNKTPVCRARTHRAGS
ncbi:MAG: class I SAM-dependent methyltransferase [Desulfosalsimonadaceae bacterium]